MKGVKSKVSLVAGSITRQPGAITIGNDVNRTMWWRKKHMKRNKYDRFVTGAPGDEKKDHAGGRKIISIARAQGTN